MTYSPTNLCSTIGADGLNFSVRNGKRWIPDAINRLNKCTVHLLLHIVRKRIPSLHHTFVNNPPSATRKRVKQKTGCMLHGSGALMYIKRADKRLRAISTARLNMSPCLHLQPINVVVYDDPNEEI